MRFANEFGRSGVLRIVSAFLLTACSVQTNKTNDGKNVDVKTPVGDIHVQENGKDQKDKSVDIKTPFGGLQVRTNDVAAKDTGLTIYPGARQAPRSEHDDSQANVNIATAWFGVKVVALKYESDDSPDKILDYYKKDMAKYGKVLQCQDGKVVGGSDNSGSDDSEELTCKDHDKKDHGLNIDMSDHRSHTTELKVGTKSHQRIVAVKPNGKGSHFDLVYVQTREKSETM
jgi:hypothetical protein